jgi:Trypsin-like peptidase domain
MLEGRICALVVALLFSLPPATAAQDLEQLWPGVVKVSAAVDGRTRTGTGFIVRLEADAAYIVTAAHVVEPANDTPARVEIEFWGRPFRPSPAKIAQLEPDANGIALLIVTGKDNLSAQAAALELGAGANAGDQLVALGFGQGQGRGGAVTRPNVMSAESRVLRLDRKVEEGNSGGPLIRDGKVVGIVMADDRGYGIALSADLVGMVLRTWHVTPSAAARPQQNRAEESKPAPDQPSAALPAPPPPAATSAINLAGRYLGRTWSVDLRGQTYVCDFVSFMQHSGTGIRGEYSNTCGDQGTFQGTLVGSILTTTLFSQAGYTCNTSASVAQGGASLTGEFTCDNGLRGRSTMSRQR